MQSTQGQLVFELHWKPLIQSGEKPREGVRARAREVFLVSLEKQFLWVQIARRVLQYLNVFSTTQYDFNSECHEAIIKQFFIHLDKSQGFYPS